LIVLGIDPGYARVGYAVIEKNCGKCLLKTCGTIETSAKTEFNVRLEEIYDRINLILREFNPDETSIESIYFQNNQKTAIPVAHARGVIVLAAQKKGSKIFEYTPLQVKTVLTGYGRASKQQIMLMTRRLLRLDSLPKPDDAADAIAIALCRINSPRLSKPIFF
jgi:crossover junction endodeoxyribonuclease RuvC